MPLVVLVAVIIAALAAAASLASRPARQMARRVGGAVRDRLTAVLTDLEARTGRTGGLTVWFAGAYVLLLGLTVGIGWLVTRAGSGPGTIDRAVTRYFVGERTEVLTSLMHVATDAGDTITIVIVGSLVGIAWRVRRGRWSGLGTLVASFVGAYLLYTAGKAVVGRARPGLDFALFDVPGQAFPSGHVTGSTAFYLALSLLIATSAIGWSAKVWLLAASASVAVMVGLSRVYLGAHWLSDVLFGAMIGGVWALVAVAPLWGRQQEREAPPRRGQAGSRTQ